MRNGRKILWISISLVLATGFVLFLSATHDYPTQYANTNSNNSQAQSHDVSEEEMPKENVFIEDPAVKAGKILSNGNCQGSGVPYKLGASPMDLDDFSMIVPYGLMVGDHVTPIDHQYFSPKDHNSALDAYEVYAMADATIADIQPRYRADRNFTEYRIVFTITCTYFYYYDLVTSLAPEIKKEYDESRSGTFRKPLSIAVKQGQLIGRIGGQTLDFAVWDTTKPLSGFVIKEHYNVEPWKIYTADPLDYYTDDLKQLLLSRYIRTAPPISGKIDYDIDARAIGNWFLQGYEGYGGSQERTTGEYWTTHLALAPNHLDPTGIIASIGRFEGKSEQFLIKNPSIHPKDVTKESGTVAYELVRFSYIKTDGSDWDRKSISKDLKIVPSAESSSHCLLVELIDDRTMKVEYFVNANCSGKMFTSNANTYVR